MVMIMIMIMVMIVVMIVAVITPYRCRAHEGDQKNQQEERKVPHHVRISLSR
jgi:heme/copper-type cytochrome/quinol oxidase subunit 2